MKQFDAEWYHSCGQQNDSALCCFQEMAEIGKAHGIPVRRRRLAPSHTQPHTSGTRQTRQRNPKRAVKTLPHHSLWNPSSHYIQTPVASDTQVVVDAAAERPDIPNPYLAQGVDAVCYSGGKCMRGPQVRTISDSCSSRLSSVGETGWVGWVAAGFECGQNLSCAMGADRGDDARFKAAVAKGLLERGVSCRHGQALSALHSFLCMSRRTARYSQGRIQVVLTYVREVPPVLVFT